MGNPIVSIYTPEQNRFVAISEEDYSIHKVLTRRYFASKNSLVLNSYYSTLFTSYTTYLESAELSATTKEHYKKCATGLMDYFTRTKVLQTSKITMGNCNAS
nr:hypothetical protein [uncultured Caproiciproducens sp.]